MVRNADNEEMAKVFQRLLAGIVSTTGKTLILCYVSLWFSIFMNIKLSNKKLSDITTFRQINFRSKFCPKDWSSESFRL